MRDNYDPKLFSPKLTETTSVSRPLPPPMPDMRNYSALKSLSALPTAIERGIKSGLESYDETKSPARAALSGASMLALEACKMNDPIHKLNATLRHAETESFRQAYPAFVRAYGEIPLTHYDNRFPQERIHFEMEYMRRTLMNDGYSSGSISRFLEFKETSQKNVRADEMGKFFKTC